MGSQVLKLSRKAEDPSFEATCSPLPPQESIARQRIWEQGLSKVLWVDLFSSMDDPASRARLLSIASYQRNWCLAKGFASPTSGHQTQRFLTENCNRSASRCKYSRGTQVHLWSPCYSQRHSWPQLQTKQR